MNSETKSASDHDDDSRRRPGQSDFDSRSDDALVELARRVEKTYFARMKMAQRLQNRGSNWSTALVALAVSSTIASICLLLQSKIYGAHGDVLLVVVAVFTLVASLTVANADYPSKARRGFETYRRLQRLSVRLEAAAATPSRWEWKRRAAFVEFDREYQQVLDESENHSAADYGRAIRFVVRKKGQAAPSEQARLDLVTRSEWTVRKCQIAGSSLVTFSPILLTFFATLFAIPSVVWTISGFPT